MLSFDATTLAAYRAGSTPQGKAQGISDSLGSGTLTVELRDGATLMYSGDFAGPLVVGADGSLSRDVVPTGLALVAGTANASTWICRIRNAAGTRTMTGPIGAGSGHFTLAAPLEVGQGVRLNISIAAATAGAGDGRPAWRDAMSLWQWTQLAGTAAFSGVTPAANPGGAYNSRLDAWNGFTAKGSSVYIAGMGGHGDYAGNEAYRLDLAAASPAWAILRQPTPAAQVQLDVSYYLDGRPSSAHLYYSLHAVGNELLRTMNGSQWGDGQHSDTKVVAFDLATNDWRAAGTYPDAPATGFARSICVDPRDGTIYFTGGTALHSRNPTTGVWTQRATWPENGTALYYRAGAVDTLRNRVVFFGNAYIPSNGGLVYDIASGVMSAIAFSGTGLSAVVAEAGNTAWYDSGLDRFLVKTPSGNALYTVNPTTWECAALSTSGGSAIANAVNGVFNKFVYVPLLGGYYYQPSHASNGWFLASE